MVDMERLKVSLTKNGYFKVAELLKVYGRWEVLEHVEGKHDGIDIKRSQIKNILDENSATGEIPEFWDSIREHGEHAIDAFTLLALLLSHNRLIELFRDASHDREEFTGYFYRKDLPREKEFTNIAYTLGCFGVSDYRRGAGAVEYNLKSMVYHLRNCGELVRALFRSKLSRAGWVDPMKNPLSPDDPLMVELKNRQFNRVLSMDWPRFLAWLEGRLKMDRPIERFGLRDVRLFTKPIALNPIQ